MRVYTYSRYSTDLQTEESIADQQRRCHEYAAAQDWRIASDFTDQGISGAALGNRPGVRQALDALQIGDVLLITDLSRLSRSQELAPLMERLRFRGARVIGVLDHFDSESAVARMQAGLSGIMSEEMRAMIRMRTHSALQMRAQQRRPTGGKTYGFDDAGAVIAHEAVVVREIFNRFGAGDTMKAIASDLNARGIPSAGAGWSRKIRRKDGFWLVSAIHALLHNERYVGRVVWNRSQWVKNPDSGKRERRERPESAWVIAEGPEIVDRLTWAAAAIRLRERAKVMRGGHGSRKYLLSGILVCERCESSLVVTGQDGRRYVCGTHKMGGSAACTVSESAVRLVAEEIVLAPVMNDLLGPEAVGLAVSLIEEQERAERAAPDFDASPELRVIAEEIRDLEALIAARPARLASLAPALQALEDRRRSLQRAAWRRLSMPAGRSKCVDDYVEVVRETREVLTGRNVEAARAALRSMTGRVPVWPESGHLVARVGLNPIPLFAAAGGSLRGSGGALWSQESQVFVLRRAA